MKNEKRKNVIRFVVNLKKRRSGDYFFLHIPKKYNNAIRDAKYLFVEIKPLNDLDLKEL